MALLLQGVVGVLLVADPGRALAGDWPYYRHDLSGTSNAGEPFTAAQAQRLAVKWQAQVYPIGNPVVAGGAVYVTDATGLLAVFDEATGAPRWSYSTRLDGPFHCLDPSTEYIAPVGSAAVVGDRVFMPGANGIVYAHDAATGNIIWQTRIADVLDLGEFLWASAFPLGDRVYFGVASLDDCLLVPGRVVALDQATGNLVGTWWANADHSPGGGVWTQPAYDPRTRRMFLTTGTIEDGKTRDQQPQTQAFVAIDPITMETLDYFSPVTTDFSADLEFGTSPVLYDTPDGRHLIAATAKTGIVYALDRDNLAAGLVWTYTISAPGVDPDLGEASISSPVYVDGVLFVAGGRTVDGQAGAVAALDAATGAELWRVIPPNGGFVLAAPVATGELLFVGATHIVGEPATAYVMCQSNGAIVFSQQTAGAIFAEPTFANGTFYVGDLYGDGLLAMAPGQGDPVNSPDPCQPRGPVDGGAGDGGAAGDGSVGDGGAGDGGVADGAAADRSAPGDPREDAVGGADLAAADAGQGRDGSGGGRDATARDGGGPAAAASGCSVVRPTAPGSAAPSGAALLLLCLLWSRWTIRGSRPDRSRS
jgi:outer membrane protein assembly factor BamB